jgi:hypothetical protein
MTEEENKECLTYCEYCDCYHDSLEECPHYCDYCDDLHDYPCLNYLIEKQVNKLKEKLEEQKEQIEQLTKYAEIGKEYVKQKDCDCEVDICMCIQARLDMGHL